MKTLLLFAGLAIGTESLMAAEPAAPAVAGPARLLRHPAYSKGKVAFSYLGDIWTVETIGGVARPVTMHEAHDINPRFSRDGRFLYVLNSVSGTVGGFAVMNDGHLSPLGVVGDFPAPGSNGLAAF